MESPLLQYAREERQRQGASEAQMGAQAIGYELAQQKMQMDKETQTKTQKLELLGGMYNASKDPGARIDLLRQIGGEAGFDTSALSSMESEFAKGMDNLIGIVNSSEAKKNPAIVTEAYKMMQLKFPGRAPSEEAKKYTIQGLKGVEGESVSGSANEVLDFLATVEGNRLAYEASLAKNKGDAAKAQKEVDDAKYEAAKRSFDDILDLYKSSLPANMQMMASPEEFMNMAKEQPNVLKDLERTMTPSDLKRFNTARGIIDARMGLTPKKLTYNKATGKLE